MARKRILISAVTPLGYRVALTRDRWREIIRFKHPAMAGNETAVRACLATPEVVRQSMNAPEVHMYYRKLGRRYLCVVVAQSEQEDRFVVTAYFTRNIKRGTEIWKS